MTDAAVITPKPSRRLRRWALEQAVACAGAQTDSGAIIAKAESFLTWVLDVDVEDVARITAAREMAHRDGMPAKERVSFRTTVPLPRPEAG